MINAYIFDMVSRTFCEELPECSFSAEEDFEVIFYGNLEELSKIPLRLDIAFDNGILIGDAKQTEIKKNSKGYEAYYSAYAIHIFDKEIPI